MYNKPVKVDSSILASRLKLCREARGINKATMARDLNITASSMTYYESGLAVPSVDKLYAIADYLYTSIDYLVGRIDKSTESIQTEKDVAELIARLADFEGIDLTHNFSTGKPMLTFESDAINAFLENRIDIGELKKDASESAIPEKYFNEMFKAKCVNEMYYLRDLNERHLQLKDGSTNAAIRRKRRLSEDNERAAAEMFDSKADSDT